MAVKDSEADNLESDLEEGEVPTCEVTPPSVFQGITIPEESRKDKSQMTHSGDMWHAMEGERCSNVLWRYPKSNRYTSNKITDYMRIPGMDTYITGEQYSFNKDNIGNILLQKKLFDNYDSSDRRLNFNHPYQNTYGSVEDLMTKIGKTLCRNKPNYYKRKKRRSKDPWNSISLNKTYTSGVILQESNPASCRQKSGRTSSCKRKHHDIDSDSYDAESNLRGRNNVSLSCRRRGKNSRKKRKEKHKSNVSDDLNSTRDIKKFKSGNKYERDFDEFRKKQLEVLKSKNLNGDVKTPEKVAQENKGCNTEQGMVISDSSTHNDYIQESLDRKTNDYNTDCRNDVDAKDTERFNLNLSVNDEDEDYDEDDEDDIELIKLRLIALTSNKKKEHMFVNDCVPEIVQNHTPDSKVSISPDPVDLVEEDRESGNKCTPEEDIDRNELLLRAEALKTALLKKHRFKINKRKNVQGDGDINHKNSIEGHSNIEKPVMDVDQKFFSSEMKAPAVEYTLTNETATDRMELNLSQETGVNELNRIEVSSNNIICDSKVKENFVPENGSSSILSNIESNCSVNIQYSTSFNVKNTAKENQILKKKLKKKKGKKNPSLNLSNIKENKDKTNEKHDEDELRSQLLNDLVKKKSMKENERKFVLVDSLQTSNIQPSSTQQIEPKVFQTSIGPETPSSNGKATPKMVMPTTELQRIIVHLGSDSSDEEAVSQSNITTESEAVSTNRWESDNKPKDIQNGDKNKMLDYEKVDLLLEAMRRGIEGKSVESAKVPSTPEAVYNHLPPSQRLEYIRLKQKIAEREKLRKANRVPCNINVTVEDNSIVYDKADSQEMQHKKSASKPMKSESVNLNTSKENSSNYEKVFREGNNFTSASKRTSEISKSCLSASDNSKINKEQQNNYSLKSKDDVRGMRVADFSSGTEKNFLLAKRKTTNRGLDLQKKILERKRILTQNRLHLERLKSLWKSIKVEKMIEEKYEKEIKRLKTQQNIFELKVNQQRLKIKKLADETKLIYEAFQKNNRRTELVGKKKAMPIAEHTSCQEKDCGKAVETIDEKNFTCVDDSFNKNTDVPSQEIAVEGENSKVEVHEDSEKTNDGTKCSLICNNNSSHDLQEYHSPLDSLVVGSESSDRPRVDPNTIMCQYDLLGKCNDEECTYQHWRA